MCSSCGPAFPASGRATQPPTSLAGKNEAPPAPTPHSADYVIAAGLRWLVIVNSPSLLSNVSRLAPQLLPPNNVQAFERSVGLELHVLHDVSVAGFDYSTLYVARGVRDVVRTREQFAARLAVDPASRQVGKATLYTGLSGDEVVHYAALDDDTTLWSSGDPTTAKAALLLAQRRLRRSPAALRGAALGTLPRHCTRGSVVAFVPGPIDLTRDVAAQTSLVLDATLALAIAVTFEDETLAVNVCWRGDWQNDGITRTKALLDGLLFARFTSLLELTNEERTGSFTQHADVVEVRYRWSAPKVLKRAQGLLSLDLEALLGSSSVAPTEPAPDAAK